MLVTVSMWLLMSVGFAQSTNQNSGRITHVVERFPDEESCKKVYDRLVAMGSEKLVCLPASVLSEKPAR